MAGIGANNHHQTMTFDVVEEAGGTLRVTLAGELDITNVDTCLL